MIFLNIWNKLQCS